MSLAKRFITWEKKEWGVGLATLEQAKMGNAQWDNL